MSLRVGIAGLGTVGCGLLSIIQADYRPYALSRNIQVTGVSARTRDRERSVPVDDYQWFDDPIALATDPQTDVFVELIGGAEGPAREAVTAALKAGKSVATANKALIAAHGAELAAIAEENGVALRFEAAVAGGTPVVQGIGGGLAPCRITSISGILNGTCNFVLDQMAQHGAGYDEAVKDAQDAGYAEADPTLDVGGIDAAQKISILAMLAYDKTVPDTAYRIRGITNVHPKDLSFARRLGHAIKLIAQARETDKGIALRVTPALVPANHSFAAQEGPGNAIAVEAEPLGNLLFTGPGAGAGATAAAVAADLVAIAKYGTSAPVFSKPIAEMEEMTLTDGWALRDRYALRLEVADPTHAADAISQMFADAGVEIASLKAGRHEIDILTGEIDERAVFDITTSLVGDGGLVSDGNYYPILAP